MRLLITLIKHELQENLTSGRYVLTSILCVALCVTSVVLMTYDYENRRKRFELSDNVHGTGDLTKAGIPIAKPPVPLSLIAKGTEEVVGRPFTLANPRYSVIGHVFSNYWEEHHLLTYL